MADGGELIVLAPGVDRFGEDETIGALTGKSLDEQYSNWLADANTYKDLHDSIRDEVAELAALRRDPGPAAGGCFAAAGVLSGSGDASTDFFTRAFAQLQA